MKARILPIALGVTLITLVSFTIGTFYGGRTGGASSAGQRQVLHYTCPMHPQYKSDKPGDCPSCGMRLVPVYADGNVVESPGRDQAVAAGAVRVNTERQQAIGVRVGVVEKASGARVLRTTGRVAPDEGRLYRLNASTDFWIREVFPPTTGSLVRKNEALLSFYSGNFLSAAASYMYALDTVDRQKATPGADTPAQNAVVDVRLRQAVDSLKALGVSQYQIDEMAQTRQISDLVTIRSPIEGFVLARNATLGQYIQPGTELYEIADLSRIWVLADVFMSEATSIRPGGPARVTLPEQGRVFQVKVSQVLPQFDTTSRTLKVRLESDNPGYLLRPGMFVDVAFDVALPPAVVVPADAVIDSGMRKTVFVDRGSGVFEPRLVKTGWRFEDQVEILEGLAPGERIVVSGTFLIDSESRMRAAAAGFYSPPARDPVCGMEVDPGKAKAAGRVADHEGTTYYFCSDECRKSFEQDVHHYLQAPSGPRVAEQDPQKAAGGDQTTDFVCKMTVDRAAATKAGLTSTYRERTFYFCSEECKRTFDANPAQYAR
jgi:RND family efflux transporter MFP subunit